MLVVECEEALLSESISGIFANAVQLSSGIGLLSNVHHAWDSLLHAKREFKILDGPLHDQVVPSLQVLRLVEFRDQIKPRTLNRRCQLVVDGIVDAVQGKDVPSTRSFSQVSRPAVHREAAGAL